MTETKLMMMHAIINAGVHSVETAISKMMRNAMMEISMMLMAVASFA